ncbi:MAG: segregation and condensation protein A [Bacillota bacterium]
MIKEGQLDILDVPISLVTEQYLAYLREMRRLDLDVASDFLVMAATLLQIKARLLLPKQSTALAEDEETDDPRQELTQRLLEYKIFKTLGAQLGELEQSAANYFARGWYEPLVTSESPPLPDGLDLQDLLAVLRRQAMQRTSAPPQEIKRASVTVGRLVRRILALVRRAGREINWREVFPGRPGRRELVSGFLALLELLRRRRIAVRQTELFGDILISIEESERGRPDA